MTKLINAIVIPAGNDLMNINIQNDKITFNEILKGDYSQHILPQDINIYYQTKADEQHQHKHLMNNFTLQYGGLSFHVHGTVIVAGTLDNEGNPTSLTANQIDTFILWLQSRILLNVPYKD